ncbi:LysR family transcriptional regulator [Pseudomonas resinovorans]|nr:LysR family transcriptional regulator [Pseudomonas resinovorans]MDE3737276.1 LysR family transcriptional regulator [Pseudomonas resinovorans]
MAGTAGVGWPASCLVQAATLARPRYVKLHQIKALVAIHRTGSLNEASQILHVTQPALAVPSKTWKGSLGSPCCSAPTRACR